jgi:hypothetical protein
LNKNNLLDEFEFEDELLAQQINEKFTLNKALD